MTLYVTDDLAFDLGEPFVDRTIHELDAPLPGPERQVFSLLIERTPLESASVAALHEAVRVAVVEDGRRLPLHRVLERRELSVAGAPAVAVVFEWTYTGARHYGRQLHVLAISRETSASHLCFSATSPFEHRAACDEYLDRLTETLHLNAG